MRYFDEFAKVVWWQESSPCLFGSWLRPAGLLLAAIASDERIAQACADGFIQERTL
jgi:hypothetical protein